MVYSFARVGAVLRMNVGDYFPNGKRWWIRLQEKGSKYHEMPLHHKAESYLDAYIAAAGIAEEKKAPLFSGVESATAINRPGAFDRRDCWEMVQTAGPAGGVTRGHLQPHLPWDGG